MCACVGPLGRGERLFFNTETHRAIFLRSFVYILRALHRCAPSPSPNPPSTGSSAVQVREEEITKKNYIKNERSVYTARRDEIHTTQLYLSIYT